MPNEYTEKITLSKEAILNIEKQLEATDKLYKIACENNMLTEFKETLLAHAMHPKHIRFGTQVWLSMRGFKTIADIQSLN